MNFFSFYNSLDPKDKVVLIGIMLTFIVSTLALIQALKKMKIDNITQNRVEWINTLRNYIADYISAIDLYKIQVSIKEEKQIMNFRDVLMQKNALIKLHLNFKGNIDKRILKMLENITQNVLLMLYLKSLERALLKDKTTALRPQIFKSFIFENPDNILVSFLKDYSIANNINSKLSKSNDEISLKDELVKVVMDYIALIDSKSFIDIFSKNLNEIYQDIVVKITSQKDELIKLIQIYLKAEWTRVKKEPLIWPLSYYNEDRTIKKLEKTWKQFNESNSRWQ